ARRLTRGAWSLAKSEPPGPPSSPLAWSPDGKSILFTQQATPHFGDADQSVVMVLDVATGESRKLTAHKAFEGYATYSPDGSRISYWYPRDGDPNNVTEIHVTTAAGGDGTVQTRAVDRNLVRAVWMPDGKSLLLGGHDGTRTALWLMPLGGAAKRIDLGEVSPAWGFWIDVSVGKDGAITFAGSTPDRPTELYYLASAAAPPRRLTDLNAEVAARQLGSMERFEWSGPDGFQSDGVVTYPPGFVRGKKYPLVLIIHGGPTAASVRAFSLFSQAVAAHDYIVFSPNYRGSDNLGNAYQRAIFNDAGDGPGRDVMAGIAALVKLGGVDTTRIAVSGWSYGGYMTSWLIGHYHVWKAAVAGAAVTNLVDQYNMADFNVLERYGFSGFGSPWTGKSLQAYRDQSPISYVAEMKTPTLILSDVRDARVTVTQSYELYHALRDNSVPVKFVAYPVDGHFPGDPVRTTDVYRRWLDWLDQYLKGPVSTRCRSPWGSSAGPCSTRCCCGTRSSASCRSARPRSPSASSTLRCCSRCSTDRATHWLPRSWSWPSSRWSGAASSRRRSRWGWEHRSSCSRWPCSRSWCATRGARGRVSSSLPSRRARCACRSSRCPCRSSSPNTARGAPSRRRTC